MAGTRPSRRERLGSAALAALLTLSVVAGVAGVGAAHGDTDHVSRDGDTLVVKLGDEHGVSETKKITVSVEGGKSYEKSVKNKTDTFRIPVTELSARKTDLKEATVAVRANGSELFNETADLQYLKFGNTKNAQFSGTTLRVPLKPALGYADDTSVSLELDGEPNAVSGTVEYRDNNTDILAVSFDAANLSLPVAKQATLSVPDRGKTTSLQLRKYVEDATEVVQDGRTLAVTNPLLEDRSYDVVVSTEQPSGRFAAPVEAGEGRLELTDSALATAQNGTVSVYRDGELLIDSADYSARTGEKVDATVADNGTTVSLDGESMTWNKTTLWLANDSRYVSVTVPGIVENGSVNLSPTPYQLDPNGSYRVIVDGKHLVRANVTGDGETNNSLFYAPANAGGNASDSNGGGLVGQFDLPFGSTLLIGLLVGFLIGGSGIVFVLRRGSNDPDPATAAGSAAGTTTRNDEYTVDIEVRDAKTGSLVTDEVTVRATQKHGNGGSTNSGHGGEETTLTDGEGTMRLDRGRWTLVAESDGIRDRKKIRVRTNKELTFDLGPQQAAVEVTDGDGEPVSDLPVTATPDEGASETSPTNPNGRVGFELPLAASRVEVAADHEKYEGDRTTLSLDGDTAEGSLSLRPLTGGLEVTATVDGAAVEGLPVEVRPREEAIRKLGESRRSATTGPDGVAAFDDLLVGTYEVAMEIPGGGDAFAVESKQVDVGDGRRARATLDAGFEYSLGRSQRDRIAAVRRDVDAMATASGRDVAIPRYYGSVVTDLLDTVERLSREGHRFATADADPDAVVSALLDAAERSVELVDDAMATKRNTDLFGACADMPDQRVEWTGGFDVDVLFELLAEDRKTQRQTVLTQLRSVDDRINDERADVAVVAPARELWEGVKEFVNAERGDDPVRGAVVAFAAGGLLDAVDELFDHERLRDRLERTVF
ncbi:MULTISPECIES: hypothetical protein [Halorussus]|uniref:hypothetical protein n=1 Tax=Halorussus TaxID=1070314 RepID=UPI000E211484|nr:MULTISPECIES: hypothetical protein [Halorussus]NHN61691.1 hypothetical protein [Halorussus sp. JP-T4]